MKKIDGAAVAQRLVAEVEKRFMTTLKLPQPEALVEPKTRGEALEWLMRAIPQFPDEYLIRLAAILRARTEKLVDPPEPAPECVVIPFAMTSQCMAT